MTQSLICLSTFSFYRFFSSSVCCFTCSCSNSLMLPMPISAQNSENTTSLICNKVQSCQQVDRLQLFPQSILKPYQDDTWAICSLILCRAASLVSRLCCCSWICESRLASSLSIREISCDVSGDMAQKIKQFLGHLWWFHYTHLVWSAIGPTKAAATTGLTCKPLAPRNKNLTRLSQPKFCLFFDLSAPVSPYFLRDDLFCFSKSFPSREIYV